MVVCEGNNPYAALSAIALDRFFGSSIIMMLIAMIQIPIYGFVLGVAQKRKKIISSAIVLSALHILATLIALSL